MHFTTILHHVRKEFELSANDYCVAELLFFRMNDPKTKMVGWCTVGRQIIADELDISRQTVITILKKLKEKGLVEENEMAFLKTTDVWFEAINRCQVSLQGVKKLDSKCKETLQGGVKKLDTSPYISNNEISKLNKEIKNKENEEILIDVILPETEAILCIEEFPEKNLSEMLLDFQNQNPKKYPSQMYEGFEDYWGAAVAKKPGIQKWQTEPTFRVAGRLATWYSRNPKNYDYLLQNENSIQNRKAGKIEASHNSTIAAIEILRNMGRI